MLEPGGLCWKEQNVREVVERGTKNVGSYLVLDGHVHHDEHVVLRLGLARHVQLRDAQAHPAPSFTRNA